ncbi:hypothetical protein N7U49_03665 [Streptomyces sp. AD2-2]|nr:hypothetical protein N7U49_03665 [Streptomyces sp. AD2-2]
MLFEQHSGRRQNSAPSDFRTFLHFLGRPCPAFRIVFSGESSRQATVSRTHAEEP